MLCFLCPTLLLKSAQAQPSEAAQLLSINEINIDQTLDKNRPLRIALLNTDSLSGTIQQKKFSRLNKFLKEYWQIWSIDNQREIRFITINLEDNDQALRNSHVDVLTYNTIDTAQPDALLTIPYAKYKQISFKAKGNKYPRSINIGIVSKDESALAYLTNTIEKSYYQSVTQLLINIDDYDYLYSENPWLLEEALTTKGLINKFTRIDNDLPEIHLHFATRERDRSLLYDINQHIRSISRLQANLWRSKYLASSNDIALTFGNYLTNLSEYEQQFVIDHNQFYYPVTKEGYPPYIITEPKNHLNEQGLSIDITKIATEKIGIMFKPLHVENIAKSLDVINHGQADIIINSENKPFTNIHLNYSTPYIDNAFQLTHRDNYPLHFSYQDLRHETIAVVDGLRTTEILQTFLPQATFIEFSSIEDAITSVAINQTNAFIGSPLVTAYINKRHKLSNLANSEITNFPEKNRISFAALNHNAHLITLLNKTLNSITSHQFDDMYSKWNQTVANDEANKQEVATVYRNMSIVIAIILVIGLMVFWAYYRKLQIRKKAQIKIEQELSQAEQARIEAEQVALERIAFLARMSHEIRTPMNGVLGMAEALVFTKLDEKQKDLLSTLNSSARNLLTLLNNVLDLSKMDAGKLTLESLPMNLPTMCQEIMESFKHMHGEAQQKKLQNIEMQLMLDPKIASRYMGDPTRLTQVLNNLLSNAIKFTERGKVLLALQIKDSYTKEGKQFDKLLFTVRDSGIGIAAEKHELLFTPFVQADSEITRKYGGTGLGLSICHEIIQAMGSSIKLDSIINRGTTFSFYLELAQAEQSVPLSPPVITPVVNPLGNQSLSTKAKVTNDTSHALPQVSSTEVLERDEDPFAKLRVLVAEDNEVNVLVITAQLARLNITPDVAENGKIALKKFQLQAYDIVISDCHMPFLDGFELATILSKEKTVRPLWIIAVTAEALSGAAQKCLNAGFDDYIAKPCTQEDINNKLHHALEKLNEMRNI